MSPIPPALQGTLSTFQDTHSLQPRGCPMPVLPELPWHFCNRLGRETHSPSCDTTPTSALSFPLFSHDTCIVGMALLASVGSNKPLAHLILSRCTWIMLLPQIPMFSGTHVHLPVVRMCGVTGVDLLCPVLCCEFFFSLTTYPGGQSLSLLLPFSWM